MNNLYKAYSVNKRKSEKAPQTTAVTFEQAGTTYRVIMTKKRARLHFNSFNFISIFIT